MLENNEAITSSIGGEPRFYVVTETGVYLGSISSAPNTPDVYDVPGSWPSWTEVPTGPMVADQIWLFPGWSESPSLIREAEIIWQTAEMAVIANQLLALEEEAEDALPGTRTQWLSYRTKVRLWHTSVDFPDSTKRPTRPVAL